MAKLQPRIFGKPLFTIARYLRKSLEDEMANLNERHEDVPSEMQSDPRIIPMASRQSTRPGEPSLIAKREMEELRVRWTAVQATFIDNPRKAVDDAKALVSDAMKQIDECLRAQRSQIEKHLSAKSAPSTEDLRLAVQQYRQFFDRLLSL